jgi:antitoxin PrlF
MRNPHLFGERMSESTVTIKGQTTLPKAVRQALDLLPGDRLRYIILDDGQVRLMRTVPVAGLAGLLRRPGQEPVQLEDMERAVSEGARGA